MKRTEQNKKFRLDYECVSPAFVVLYVGTGLCEGPITHSEEFYQMCVTV